MLLLSAQGEEMQKYHHSAMPEKGSLAALSLTVAFHLFGVQPPDVVRPPVDEM